MTVLALYIPKPEDLTEAVALLVFAYVFLCALAYRMKLSIPLAAVLMLIGCGLALIPMIVAATHKDLGPIGKHARELSKTDHSDAFFAMTSYMHVGPGKLLVFGGMSVMLICHAVVAAILNKLKRPASPPKQEDIPDKQSPSDRADG